MSILYYLVGLGTYKIQIRIGAKNAKVITKNYKIFLSAKWDDNGNKNAKC